MLEDIHRRDHVERVGWELVDLRIDDLGLQATLIGPPARELEQRRTDVRQGEFVAVAGGQDRTRVPEPESR